MREAFLISANRFIENTSGTLGRIQAVFGQFSVQCAFVYAQAFGRLGAVVSVLFQSLHDGLGFSRVDRFTGSSRRRRGFSVQTLNCLWKVLRLNTLLVRRGGRMSSPWMFLLGLVHGYIVLGCNVPVRQWRDWFSCCQS